MVMRTLIFLWCTTRAERYVFVIHHVLNQLKGSNQNWVTHWDSLVLSFLTYKIQHVCNINWFRSPFLIEGHTISIFMNRNWRESQLCPYVPRYWCIPFMVNIAQMFTNGSEKTSAVLLLEKAVSKNSHVIQPLHQKLTRTCLVNHVSCRRGRI